MKTKALMVNPSLPQTSTIMASIKDIQKPIAFKDINVNASSRN